MYRIEDCEYDVPNIRIEDLEFGEGGTKSQFLRLILAEFVNTKSTKSSIDMDVVLQ